MKKSKKRVIPGFGLTMGVTITMLSIVVLIPLASLVIYSSQLGFNEFIQLLCEFYYGSWSFFCKCSDGADPGMGAGTL